MLLAACDGRAAVDALDGGLSDDTGSAADDAGPVDPRIAARPYLAVAPRSYDGSRALPLVLFLHDYGHLATQDAASLGLRRAVDARGFLLALPDGTADATGNRFWSATDACCDFGRTGVDDAAYLAAVLDDMVARYRVDARHVYAIGLANGGFMAHRLGCAQTARFAGIVSIAGAGFATVAQCAGDAPLAVLEVHGDEDDLVAYDGGSIAGVAFPAASGSLAPWILRDGCGPLADATERLDLDRSLDGAETRIARAPHCAQGAAELWTVTGGGHVLAPQPDVATRLLDWLDAHAVAR